MLQHNTGPVTMVRRALRLRCPHCGGRPVFISWTRMLPNCPVCGLRFERGEQGYWLGAYFFNLMVMEIAFAVWVVAALVWTWPTPPWGRLQWEGIGLMLALPIAFFPFSKTLFLAFDLWVRPPSDEDFDAPHEVARNTRRSAD